MSFHGPSVLWPGSNIVLSLHQSVGVFSGLTTYGTFHGLLRTRPFCLNDCASSELKGCIIPIRLEFCDIFKNASY